MYKKYIFLILAAIMLPAVLVAEAEFGLGFTNSLEAETAEKETSNTLWTTELTAEAAFQFDAFVLTPWISGQFEDDGGDWTNFASIGVTAGYSFADAFSVSIDMAFCLAALINDPAEYRIIPSVAFDGTASGFGYELGNGYEITIADDDVSLDIEGSLFLGYAIPAGSTELSFELEDEMDFDLGTSDADDDQELENNAILKFVLGYGDLAPYVGFSSRMISGSVSSDEMELSENFLGAAFGISFAKENWSLSFDAEAGRDTKENGGQNESLFVLTLEIGI
jgi:hypothetical protein